MIPYGRHTIEQDEIDAVVEVLRSDWLTTGPMVEEFESALADYIGANNAVAVSSGTAALHAVMNVLKIGPGDEVIVPAITFAATANAVVYQGGSPVFADVDPDTLLIDANEVERLVTGNTRAVVAVDYAGQPCDYDSLRRITDKHDLRLVSDACHALGAKYRDAPVGLQADLTVFSFHPVKHITTGEGGAVVTDDKELANRLRRFRNHGITLDHRMRAEQCTWEYDISEIGYNYRITDFQCALGLRQLGKIQKNIKRRNEIARVYDDAFAELQGVEPLGKADDVTHAYHLYVLRVDGTSCSVDRDRLYHGLRARGVGVNVHYKPVYLHSFYRKHFNTTDGLCPNAEKAYDSIISLPMYHSMKDEEVRKVIESVRESIK